MMFVLVQQRFGECRVFQPRQSVNDSRSFELFSREKLSHLYIVTSKINFRPRYRKLQYLVWNNTTDTSRNAPNHVSEQKSEQVTHRDFKLCFFFLLICCCFKGFCLLPTDGVLFVQIQTNFRSRNGVISIFMILNGKQCGRLVVQVINTFIIKSKMKMCNQEIYRDMSISYIGFSRCAVY